MIASIPRVTARTRSRFGQSVMPFCPMLLSLSCRGFLGPVLECPESLEVGDEVVLFTVQVDDALEWAIDFDGERLAVFILPDGTEDTVATTSVERIGPTGAPTDRTEIILRAENSGTLVIRVQETTIGPGIGLPRRLGADACTITIFERAD